MDSFSLIMKTEEHEKYYTKAGYKNAANLIIKVKWFKEENQIIQEKLKYNTIYRQKQNHDHKLY